MMMWVYESIALSEFTSIALAIQCSFIITKYRNLEMGKEYERYHANEGAGKNLS